MRIRMRLLAVGLAVMMMTGALTGCGDTRIVLTKGLASDELFSIGDVTCEISEALVYLNTQKNQYEEIYGVEMWNHDFGDMTMGDYLKNQVVSQLAQIKSMVVLAAEREISLSEDEVARAKTASEEYLNSLSEAEMQALQVDQEIVQKMYEEYCLAYKAYEQITQDVSVEISDDKARIIQLQQIFVPEENLAKELKEKLDAGENFESLAANYSKASQTTIAIARGEKSEVYEEIAFNLGNEEVSEVFQAEEGYYILKCLDTYMEEESEANKQKVAQKQKTERFQQIYAELMGDTLSEFQQKLWDEVLITDYEDVESSSFFEIYQKYYGN